MRDTIQAGSRGVTMVTTEHVNSVDTVTDVTVISPLARNLFLLDGLIFSFQIAQKREPMRGTVWEVGSLDNYLNFPNRLSHSNSKTLSTPTMQSYMHSDS